MVSYTCRSDTGDAWFTTDFNGKPTAGRPLSIGSRHYVIVDVRPGKEFPPLDPTKPVLIVRSV
jgi:hypothetical protein